jgi:hypothetical protein
LEMCCSRNNLVPAMEIEVGKRFRACLAWDRGRKEGRVQEIWTWEGIHNSDVPSPS